MIRTAKPHKILEPDNGPLIAVKLNILTRKSLGGNHTILQSQALNTNGEIIAGLFAAEEAAGFGGGGYHGYNALEGTFLGGCIFSAAEVTRAISLKSTSDSIRSQASNKNGSDLAILQNECSPDTTWTPHFRPGIAECL